MKAKLFSIGFVVIGGWFAIGVTWADPPVPVPASGGLRECVADLGICTGDLGTCDVALGTCTTELTTCDTDLGTCNTDLTETTTLLNTCTSDLATCEATGQAFPATGQTSCWDSSGVSINCAGTGHDGDIQAGADLSYADTGLTIIDNNTKLEWAKQDESGGIHDKDNTHSWDDAFAFVDVLNDSAFAGHTDWRVPNIKELLSIVNYENVAPPVSEVFHDAACVSGCILPACSCTAVDIYWSSTSSAASPHLAWIVFFGNGRTVDSGKGNGRHVRAVRGGL